MCTFSHTHVEFFDVELSAHRLSVRVPVTVRLDEPDVLGSKQLFADHEKEPPQLDYTQMLLYFACHPDSMEGVYRALSVAIGTHVFQPIKVPAVVAEKTSSLTDMSPVEEYLETKENFISEERELQEKGEEKEEEIPENANTEMISMETLLKVFGGGNETQDSNRFACPQKTENVYLEVQGLVGYVKRGETERGKELDLTRTGSGELSWQQHQQKGQPKIPKGQQGLFFFFFA
ncbi:hypothetical protein CB1_011123002 [Camelus ferus]|nr:hypothetical protein CB1_011123002 [Camelus ferus]